VPSRESWRVRTNTGSSLANAVAPHRAQHDVDALGRLAIEAARPATRRFIDVAWYVRVSDPMESLTS
jgi:hypothetical protein